MDLKSRLKQVFELCNPLPEAVLLESASHGAVDPNFCYVTGFERSIPSGASAILRLGERPLVMVSLMEGESAMQNRNIEVSVARNRREHDAAIGVSLGSCRRIGYNPSGLSVARFDVLKNLLPGAEWLDVSSALVRARLVKTGDEILWIRRAAELSAIAMEEVPSLLVQGMAERDLAAEIDYRLHKRGATGHAFDTIVAFGPNGAEPHHHSGEATLVPGSLVLVDLGARYRRYCADLTRTLAFGEVGEVETRMHAVVLAAREAALGRLLAGTNGREVHEAADRVIEETEFKGCFVHAVGHSVGLEAQDGIALHSHSDFTVGPGMVFAVEPGVYVPGIGGVRIEDTVLVTDGGIEILTVVPTELATERWKAGVE
ncbi:MAG: aminopeptidase P family protein, partial [Candidatus Eisenbacteria sp.]|nr:aminopeptidase P family protein [Candidatus Eisenbacteria bacterium]